MPDNKELPVLFSLNNMTVSLAGRPVLDNFSLTIRKGEAVAITGAGGSGKTVLAHTLAGRHFYRGGFSVGGNVDNFHRSVQVVEQQHRFLNRNQTADQYYQQRFNALNSNETLTVEEELSAYGNGNGAFPRERLLDLFGIRSLLSEPLIQLSNGENKRLQMVKALLLPHDLLILDQPFTGLDAAGRQALSALLGELQKAGETLLLISGIRDIPVSFRRQVHIGEGRVLRDGALEWTPVDLYGAAFSAHKETDGITASGNGFAEWPLSGTMLFDYPAFGYAFRLQHVNVRYDDRLILDDVCWSVKSGECWRLSGPNGAGKSTLLSLVTGDNPQAYANDITLFDRRRGTGESIWEIKQRIGLVSPELHLFFDPAATVYAGLASGLFDTVGLFRSLSDEQDALVKEWAVFLGLAADMNILLHRLPAGKQRIALLGRALIKRPPLLVLDEPCQGLDENGIESVKRLIDRYCREHRATLIYVSHYAEESPACITHTCTLTKGKLSVMC